MTENQDSTEKIEDDTLKPYLLAATRILTALIEEGEYHQAGRLTGAINVGLGMALLVKQIGEHAKMKEAEENLDDLMKRVRSDTLH